MSTEHPLCLVVCARHRPTGLAASSFFNEHLASAIGDAGYQALFLWANQTGQGLHADAIEALRMADAVVVDLGAGDANGAYALAIRHAFRSGSTICLAEQRTEVLWDSDIVPLLRYSVTDLQQPQGAKTFHTRLSKKLQADRRSGPERICDSPAFQLLPGYRRQATKEHERRQYRERATDQQRARDFLQAAMAAGDAAQIGTILQDHERDRWLRLELLQGLSGRPELLLRILADMPAAWLRSPAVADSMIAANTELGRLEQAIRCGDALIQAHGASSERLATQGRLYRSLWERSSQHNEELLSEAHRLKAIGYLESAFSLDMRAAQTGIELVRLLAIGQSDQHQRMRELIAVVRYAWLLQQGTTTADTETALLLAVLAADTEAVDRLRQALPQNKQKRPQLAVEHLAYLQLLRRKRLERGIDEGWLQQLLHELAPEHLALAAATRHAEHDDTDEASADPAASDSDSTPTQTDSAATETAPTSESDCATNTKAGNTDYANSEHQAPLQEPSSDSNESATNDDAEAEPVPDPDDKQSASVATLRARSAPPAGAAETIDAIVSDDTGTAAEPAESKQAVQEAASNPAEPPASASDHDRRAPPPPLPQQPEQTAAPASAQRNEAASDSTSYPPLAPDLRPEPRAYPEKAYTQPARKNRTMPNSTTNQDLPDRALRAQNYLEADFNLAGQQQWYDRKASKNRKWSGRLGLLIILCGAATSIVQLWAPLPPPEEAAPGLPMHWTTLSTALLGAAIIIAKGVERIWQFDDNWLSYRKAAEGIKREQRLYINAAGDYTGTEEEAYRSFVEKVEGIIASEQNSFWQQSDKGAS